MATCTINIIVGGQSSTALTIIFVDADTKSCTSANKTDTNRVTTTRSMNQLETLHRNKPSRDTNGFAWIYSLECNNWIFINLLLNSSWSWTPFPPYITWRVHRWMQITTKGFETGRVSYPDSPYNYCLTVLLSYCTTILLSYWLTVLLSYWLTVLLSYWLTVLLSYCLTVLLSYCLTVLLSYCLTV